MKKFIASVLTFLTFFCLCLFTACSHSTTDDSSSDSAFTITGTYQFHSFARQTPDDYQIIHAGVEYEGKIVPADAWLLTLREDNTFVMEISMFGSPDSTEGVWSSMGQDKIELSSAEGKEGLVFLIEGDLINCSYAPNSTDFYHITLKKAQTP